MSEISTYFLGTFEHGAAEFSNIGAIRVIVNNIEMSIKIKYLKVPSRDEGVKGVLEYAGGVCETGC